MLKHHEYSSSAQLGGILYGSVKSIHHSSALVYTKSNFGGNVPGFIERFVRIKVLLQVGDKTESKQIIVAKIKYLIEHEQKNWYGTWAPAEVWNVYTSQAFGGVSDYVPIYI